MRGRMLRRELSRNKTISATLCVFILLSAMLISLAASLITQLFGAMDTLFKAAQVPHFVQMHSGEVMQPDIDAFSAVNELVQDQQTVEMLNVTGSKVVLGSGGTTQAASVMEMAFITQNQSFDFLLDTDGIPAVVGSGEVGVPVYFMRENKLRIGDTMWIDCGEEQLKLTIACFVRDAQMNPSVVTSKRFLLSQGDWQTIHQTVGTSEYLIEFLLPDASYAGEFEQQYAASGLPQSDTAITFTLFQLLNAISDGLLAAVVIFVSLLLVLVSMLCLRYTILGALEDDISEIGVMKAIGLSAHDLRSLYMVKFLALAGVSCLAGYVVSIPLSGVLAGNITLYMGSAPKTMWSYFIPLIAVLLIFLLVVLIVRFMLRRLECLSAVEALRAGAIQDIRSGKRRISFKRSSLKTVNLLLALQDIWLHLKSYCLLGFVFTVCAFLAITPLNLYNTVSSPQFVSYMGAGDSDLRVDIQSGGNMAEQFTKIAAHLEADPDISHYAAFITGTFQAWDAADSLVNIKVETGNFAVFPVEYAAGNAPQTKSEIALSAMNADELGANLGETIVLLVDDVPLEMTVCGIYQDVTNGGKTAKALLPVNEDNALWYVINLNVKEGVSVAAKKAEYGAMFTGTRILDMADYLGQTLGGIIGGVRTAGICAVVVALAISILITAMFLNMMMAKDRSQTIILQCLGFTSHDLLKQYVFRSLLTLLTGILLGTVAAGVLGQSLAGMFLSMMGASSIRFIVNPFISYLLIPGLLAVSVTLTCLVSSRSAGKNSGLRPL